MIEGIVPRTFI